MSGFPILDLVAGIIFIYFLLSIISSSAVEMVMTAFKLRGKMLGKWLREIFNLDVTLPDGTKQKLGRAIMDHCSVTGLSKSGKAPSYIDAKNFTSAFLEKITYDPENKHSIAMDLDTIIDSIKKSESLPHSLQRVLLTYAYEARDKYAAISKATVTEATSIMSEVDLFKEKIERWFDTNMDRVSGSLKIKYIRPLTLAIGFIAVVSLNADSIAIAKFLYTNPEARASMAAQAYNVPTDSVFLKQVKNIKAQQDTSKKDTATMDLQQIKDTLIAQRASIMRTKAVLESSGLPLGWNKDELRDPSSHKFSWKLLISKITGLLATILAVMMGAPFWFDVLNKISNMRSAGKKPDSSS